MAALCPVLHRDEHMMLMRMIVANVLFTDSISALIEPITGSTRPSVGNVL
jgi:hypothetical protein